MTAMTHEAGALGPPLQPQPVPQWAPQTLGATARKRIRLGDRYFTWLCLVLLGYALGGRGFAYWGVNPIFIGEITLLLGLAVILRLNIIGRLMRIRAFIPLLIFMFWGVVCTVPYLEIYKKDAIRDAVVWGYGNYAFIMAGLLIASPQRVQKLVLNYRKFVIWFLLLAPVASVVCSFFEGALPLLPGSGVPVIQVKGGDMCVHLAGSFAYLVALGTNIPFLIPTLFVPLNLGLNIQGRAGMVSFFLACAVSMILRPFHPRAMRIFFVLALGFFFLWASDLRIEKGARELSFNMLLKGFGSIVGDSDEDALRGSKEWRMKWWSDIVNYTVYGRYFWTGKGFGVNLATDDGYEVEGDDALRSPHSGHMTVLARMGVPGMGMWVLLHATWAVMVVRAYFRARRHHHMNWSGLFMFLGCYWAAFMANTSFDVFIEGPMGGIWLWCIYGAGIACAYIYKRYPELLTPARPAPIAVQPPAAHLP